MTRGRKPLPKSLHALRGNPSKLKLNQPDDPEFIIEIPAVPDTLDKFGREEWERVTRIMLASKTITELDEAIVEAYCQNRSDLRRHRKALKDESDFITSERSGLKHLNPRVELIRKLVAEQRLLIVELGFSPSSRSKVKTVAKTGKALSPEQKLASRLFGKSQAGPQKSDKYV